MGAVQQSNPVFSVVVKHVSDVSDGRRRFFAALHLLRNRYSQGAAKVQQHP